MGLSECLPLKAFSEKFICHVLQLPGHQWFFKCILYFLPCSQPVRRCRCSSTRNATYVRREKAHPAHVQHVLQGRHKPKQIATAKRCLLVLITGRVKHRSSQKSFCTSGNRSSRSMQDSLMGKDLQQAKQWSRNGGKWSLLSSVGAVRKLFMYYSLT